MATVEGKVASITDGMHLILPDVGFKGYSVRSLIVPMAVLQGSSVDIFVKKRLSNDYKFLLLRAGEQEEDGLHTRVYVYNPERIEILDIPAPLEHIGERVGDDLRRKLYRNAAFELGHKRYTFIMPTELSEKEVTVPRQFYGWRERKNLHR